MKKTAISLLITTALLASGGALACKSQKHGGGHWMERFDSDKNAALSEDEFNQMLAYRAEKMARKGRHPSASMQPPQFSEVDTDANGELSLDEMRAARDKHRQAMREQRQAMHSQMREGGPMRHSSCPHHKGGMKMQPPAFEDIDTDKDGMISPDEFAEHRAKMHGK